MNNLARFIKNSFDFIVALSLLIAFMPIILICGIIIFMIDGRPIFFSQDRPGLHGKIFKIYKFRTMRNQTEANLSDFERMSKFGNFMRKTSLDELPQLLNVLRGELSLVGPRPLLVEYLSLYNKQQMRRHDVKPGITGWAQVNGRNAISWEKKFELDVWYVDNWSLALDFKILLMTVAKVLKRSGVNSREQQTMDKFKGSLL